jgi:hypothetical protein
MGLLMPPIGYAFRTDSEMVADLILAEMQAERDDSLLREMNGRKCARRQIQHLASFRPQQEAE